MKFWNGVNDNGYNLRDFEMEKQQYNAWLQKEYDDWCNAIYESPFHGFKKHPQVIRMTGLDGDYTPYLELVKDMPMPWVEIEKVDRIGSPLTTMDIHGCKINGATIRFVYYANQVLDKIKDMHEPKLLEIGAGYGGFCSVIHVLAKHRGIEIKEYGIFDLLHVQRLQNRYLNRSTSFSGPGIQKITFFDPSNIAHFPGGFDYIMSFYALGEFSNEVKQGYFDNVISKTPHGFIVWNAHSGADKNIGELLKKIPPNAIVSPEYPLTSPGNLQITF